MNIEKHFIGSYKLGKWDCWTLVQDIFLEEHGLQLPDYPHMTQSKEDFRKLVFTNILIEEVKEPEKGLFACYVNNGTIHTGYVLNDKEYIHRPESGTRVDKIRPAIKMYRVKGIKYE